MTGLDAASFRTHGPNLDGTGSKVNAGWLYAWVRNPKGYWHETRMPNLRLTEKEAADVTAYLMSLKNEAFAARPRPALDKAVRDDILLEQYLRACSTRWRRPSEKLDAMDDQRTHALPRARRRSAATAASAATTSPASRRPPPSAWS